MLSGLRQRQSVVVKCYSLAKATGLIWAKLFDAVKSELKSCAPKAYSTSVITKSWYSILEFYGDLDGKKTRELQRVNTPELSNIRRVVAGHT
ncbi:hypothetical protein EVAR_101329_1 [Eumeta japonica]|uniref:Uncharacterized protein n=1 Tax=Eumeta variegata TaxID=151549 RepID=A0A4C1TB34_EUMVA|nr:hypothetical protein EVAR_101329_1 [Eumeta japonica]